MSRARARLTLALIAVGAVVVATLIRTFATPAPPLFFSFDQPAYLSLARDPFVQTPAVYPPATWRVLPPLVARGISEGVGGGPERGFLVLTFACFALMPIAAFAWLGALGISLDIALWCAAVVALSPTVMGYTAWDVVRVDPWSTLLLFVAAWAVARRSQAIVLATIVALALSKETVLVAAVFAIAWGAFVDRRMLATGASALVLAVVIRVVLLQRILMPPPHPFDNFFSLKAMIRDELTVRYAARRLLLASATTWNLMLPLSAAWLASRWRNGRAQALFCGIVTAEAQILFASDTQRVVAAAYPFVIACCALALERLDRRWRAPVCAVLVAGQIPWLLENGRIVHLGWLRGVEIAIVFVSVGLVILRLRRPPLSAAHAPV